MRMAQQIKSLSRLINANQVIKDLTTFQLDEYVYSRLQEPSPTKRGQAIAPKTVKEALNLSRNVLNRALQYEVISKVPVSRSYYEDRQRLQESFDRRGVSAITRGMPTLVETYCYHGP